VRAIVIPRHGPPEVFEEREVEPRAMKPQDVRVRVEAAGVNFADLMGRVGLYPDAPAMPYAPGYEVAGVVEEAGAAAGPELRPGTRVMAVTRFWGYADQVRVPSHATVPIPAAMSFETAAAIPVNYLTAHLALVHVGNARAGERVLVHGGAGGVGLAALDLARPVGAEVYATAGSDEKCRWLERERGVAKAVNYRTEDYEKALMTATRNKGFHVILDPLGPASFDKGLRMLAPLGRLVCYGFSSLVTGRKRSLWHAATSVLTAHKVNPITLMNKNVGVFGLNLAHLFDEKDLQHRGLAELVRGYESGAVKPTIATTFPLTARGAAEAHAYLHDRKNVGKVVLVRGR
jgi:NADPH:quinone reductase-like Zn-dependent oxidoreductase